MSDLLPPLLSKNYEGKRLKLKPNLFLQIYDDLKSCRTFWEKFSPKNSVFDLWDIRHAFYLGYRFKPFTFSLYENKESDVPLAVLPLWFDSDSDCKNFVWFGSNWPEDNTFFVMKNNLIPKLLDVAPDPLELACIKDSKDIKNALKIPGFSPEEEKKFILPINKFKSTEDYLKNLKKKKRYNLLRDKKRIHSLAPRSLINNFSHIDDLFRLNIQRFRAKFAGRPLDYSSFEDPRRQEIFRNLIKNSGAYQIRLISTIINRHIEAVEFSLVYNKTYYALNSGANVKEFPGIGVYSNLLVIEDALNLGCHTLDFLEGDNNWKDSWGLKERTQYQFKK